MKKSFCIILTLFVISTATLFNACDRGGIAIGLVKSQNNNVHTVSFYSLEGTYSFDLNNPLKGVPSILYYSTLVEDGEFNLYVQVNGEKHLIVNTKAGEYVDASEKYFEDVDFSKERKVKIIIETVNKAKNGKDVLQFTQKNA